MASANCKVYLFLYYNAGLSVWANVESIVKFGDLFNQV